MRLKKNAFLLKIMVGSMLSISSVSNSIAASDILDVKQIDVTKEPPILRSLLSDKKGQYRFVRKTDMGKGMFGYLFHGPKGKPVVVYKTPNNRLVLGDLINIDGTNQNKLLMIQSGLVKSDSEKYQDLQNKTDFIPLFEQKGSDSKEQVFVFYDPFCPHCKHLGLALESMKQDGVEMRQVNWIPVDFLSGNAAEVIAGIGYDPEKLKGLFEGKTIKSKPSIQVKKGLSDNQVVASEFEISAVPAIVYYRDGKLKQLAGAPTNPVELKKIFGN